MIKLKEILGIKYGRLTPIKEVESYTAPSGGSFRKFECLCDCGKTTEVLLASLRRGLTASCGCLRAEALLKAHTKHGKTKHPLYGTWKGIKSRCLNQKDAYYQDYGGRGIELDESWVEFDNFLNDMGDKPEGTSIDRIDNDKGYSKSNCRWATTRQQNNNQRSNRILTYNNESLSISQWARRTGINKGTLKGRANLGWATKDILTKPVRKRELQQLKQ